MTERVSNSDRFKYKDAEFVKTMASTTLPEPNLNFGLDYWQSQPATLDGVLGGFGSGVMFPRVVLRCVVLILIICVDASSCRCFGLTAVLALSSSSRHCCLAFSAFHFFFSCRQISSLRRNLDVTDDALVEGAMRRKDLFLVGKFLAQTLAFMVTCFLQPRDSYV